MSGLLFVSWNCAGGLGKKWRGLLERIDFDVAVLTECSPLSSTLLGESPREVTQVVRKPVADSRQPKHIGVFARAPWRVEEVEHVASLPWLVHSRVTHDQGRFETFDVLAVWGLGREFSGGVGYAKQTQAVIEQVLAKLPAEHPVILAGDLNTPIDSNKADARVQEGNVARLRQLDLVSAFSGCNRNTDAAKMPTYFGKWKKENPFHIDHVFVPYNWCDRHGFSMSIGRYEDWVAPMEPRMSDHVPLVVRVPPPGAPQRKAWRDLADDARPRSPQVRGSGPKAVSSPQE